MDSKIYEKHNFSLVELLTVIAVIAILAGMLFPAINAIKEKGRETKARAMAKSLLTAIKAYESQFGLYPCEYNSTRTDYATTYNLDGDSNQDKDIVWYDYDATVDNNKSSTSKNQEKYYDEMMANLGIDVSNDNFGIPTSTSNTYTTNKRKIVFLEGPASGNSNSERTYHDPFISSDVKYGMRFGVAIDLNGDNKVKIGSTTLRGKVFVWSFGPDHTNNNGAANSDDITTWSQ